MLPTEVASYSIQVALAGIDLNKNKSIYEITL